MEKLFTKRFEFSSASYVLPASNRMFVGPRWEIATLQVLKWSLNHTKSRLNDFQLTEWQSHTRRRNPAGDVQRKLRREINPEFLTQAWCKFYEIVCSFPLIPQVSLDKRVLTSVHLCEAPGAFITSLNHYLKLNHPEISWTWTASTLNPHYEGNSLSKMINDDRFILHTSEHWYFGEDNTGDLMTTENLEGIVRRGKVMLVTADGSISCLDSPDEQEAVVAHLHYCEAVVALHILEEGGSLLLKIFTIFELETICLLYLLRCCFQRMILTKPATSKEGNSEVYVVCLGFIGEAVTGCLANLREKYEKWDQSPMFQREDVPEEFVEEIVKAEKLFGRLQREVIEGNIRSFEVGGKDKTWGLRKAVAEEWMRRFGVRAPGKQEEEVVGSGKLGMFWCDMMESRFSEESFNDRKRKKEMQTVEKMRRVQEEVRCLMGKGTFRFHLQNDPGALKISLGKPFEKIQSSRFCFAKMLQHLNLGFEVIDELQLKFEFPQAKIKTRFIEAMRRENKKVYSFEYTPVVDTNLIRNVHGIFEGVEENQTIILFGYCLLTQLNVGILYLLAHAFESLTIESRNDLGVIVTLEKARKDCQRVLEPLREIVEASERARDKDRFVISIFPIVKLCACELYQKILIINHGVIKHIINHIVHMIDNS